MNVEEIVSHLKEVAPKSLVFTYAKYSQHYFNKDNHEIHVGIIKNYIYVAEIIFKIKKDYSDMKISFRVNMDKWDNLEILSSTDWSDFMRFAYFVKSKYGDFLFKL